jgi:hypothetical protein
MKIVQGFPPNIEKIKAKFNLTGKSPIFCWGEIIYYPGGTELPEHLIVHESVHSEQQKEAGGPEIWWAQYLDDPGFRLSQEGTAYRAQYQFIKAHDSRQVRRQMLKFFATDLSSPMYGNLVSHDEAIKLIENA